MEIFFRLNENETNKDINNFTLAYSIYKECEKLPQLNARVVADMILRQCKDRIENQRMTRKGFRYEILPSTENSPRRVKDYNEYCVLYNRLAELEDKIEDGTLAELKDYRRN